MADNNAFLDFVRQQQASAATSGGDNKSMGGALGCLTIGLLGAKSPWQVNGPLEAISTQGLANTPLPGLASMAKSSGGDKWAAVFHQMHADIAEKAKSVVIGVDGGSGGSWQIYVSTRDNGAGDGGPSLS